MNKLLIVVLCTSILPACTSMDVRPTVGVSVGTSI